MEEIHSIFLILRPAGTMPFRGLAYELATRRASRDVEGGKPSTKPTARPELFVWSRREPGGPTGIFMSSVCLLGSFLIKNINSLSYGCVCIKMNIIRAGFVITYSLLLQ